jgi:hypothetical protein
MFFSDENKEQEVLVSKCHNPFFWHVPAAFKQFSAFQMKYSSALDGERN